MAQVKMNYEQVIDIATKMSNNAAAFANNQKTLEGCIKALGNACSGNLASTMQSELKGANTKIVSIQESMKSLASFVTNAANAIREADMRYTDSTGTYEYHTNRGYLPNTPERTPDDNYYTAANGVEGSVYKWNDLAYTQVSCTYHTLKRLREHGRDFPFSYAGGANGKEWFSNCTGVPKIAGSNPLSSVVNKFGNPIENIVISCGANEEFGHVMLIDKIENGMVYFSEHCPIPSSWGIGPPCSIDTFENYYNKYIGGIIGAVVIG
jgi:uncharacterized protein YukE